MDIHSRLVEYAKTVTSTTSEPFQQFITQHLREIMLAEESYSSADIPIRSLSLTLSAPQLSAAFEGLMRSVYGVPAYLKFSNEHNKPLNFSTRCISSAILADVLDLEAFSTILSELHDVFPERAKDLLAVLVYVRAYDELPIFESSAAYFFKIIRQQKPIQNCFKLIETLLRHDLATLAADLEIECKNAEHQQYLLELLKNNSAYAANFTVNKQQFRNLDCYPKPNGSLFQELMQLGIEFKGVPEKLDSLLVGLSEAKTKQRHLKLQQIFPTAFGAIPISEFILQLPLASAKKIMSRVLNSKPQTAEVYDMYSKMTLATLLKDFNCDLKQISDPAKSVRLTSAAETKSIISKFFSSELKDKAANCDKLLSDFVTRHDAKKLLSVKISGFSTILDSFFDYATLTALRKFLTLPEDLETFSLAQKFKLLISLMKQGSQEKLEFFFTETKFNFESLNEVQRTEFIHALLSQEPQILQGCLNSGFKPWRFEAAFLAGNIFSLVNFSTKDAAEKAAKVIIALQSAAYPVCITNLSESFVELSNITADPEYAKSFATSRLVSSFLLVGQFYSNATNIDSISYLPSILHSALEILEKLDDYAEQETFIFELIATKLLAVTSNYRVAAYTSKDIPTLQSFTLKAKQAHEEWPIKNFSRFVKFNDADVKKLKPLLFKIFSHKAPKLSLICAECFSTKLNTDMESSNLQLIKIHNNFSLDWTNLPKLDEYSDLFKLLSKNPVLKNLDESFATEYALHSSLNELSSVSNEDIERLTVPSCQKIQRL